MFKKILIANRGVRAAGTGVRSSAQQVSVTPHRVARAACGNRAEEMKHV